MLNSPPPRGVGAAVLFWVLLRAATVLPQQAPAPATQFKFDLGPGRAPDGFVQVRPEAAYSADSGYGFDLGCRPTGVERGGDDAARDGLITSDQPIFFSVKVPEGNYRVTVTLGDPQGESVTTVRTEVGRLMAAEVRTAAGQVEKRTFIANVRRPTLPPPPNNAPGWSQVHMFLRGEAESRVWDEKLTLEFNSARPCVSAIEIVKDDSIPTVFVAGDSTVGDPRRGPGGNWPTQMCQFFKPTVAICNSAEGGETSKSFITGARFDKVLSQMKPGDFLLVQFGHNDSKAQWPQTYTEPATSFKAYLKVYLAETRRRGGTLVLVTPMERRANEDSVGPWARAMREFAAEEKVALVDQWAMSKKLWAAMGADVRGAFTDQTHLSGYGGYLLSKVVVAGIRENVPELARHVVDDFKPLDVSSIDARPAYLDQPGGPGGREARSTTATTTAASTPSGN